MIEVYIYRLEFHEQSTKCLKIILKKHLFFFSQSLRETTQIFLQVLPGQGGDSLILLISGKREQKRNRPRAIGIMGNRS